MKTDLSITKKPANGRKGAVIGRIFLGLIISIVSLNAAKWFAIGLFKIILWLGILPYLEKFFGWFVF